MPTTKRKAERTTTTKKKRKPNPNKESKVKYYKNRKLKSTKDTSEIQVIDRERHTNKYLIKNVDGSVKWKIVDENDKTDEHLHFDEFYSMACQKGLEMKQNPAHCTFCSSYFPNGKSVAGHYKYCPYTEKNYEVFKEAAKPSIRVTYKGKQAYIVGPESKTKCLIQMMDDNKQKSVEISALKDPKPFSKEIPDDATITIVKHEILVPKADSWYNRKVEVEVVASDGKQTTVSMLPFDLHHLFPKELQEYQKVEQ
eukprot:UN31135